MAELPLFVWRKRENIEIHTHNNKIIVIRSDISMTKTMARLFENARGINEDERRRVNGDVKFIFVSSSILAALPKFKRIKNHFNTNSRSYVDRMK